MKAAQAVGAVVAVAAPRPLRENRGFAVYTLKTLVTGVIAVV
jgi:hypothetical protein